MYVETVNELTKTYMVLGFVVAIAITVVFNLEKLVPIAKLGIAAVILLSGIGYGVYLDNNQENIVANNIDQKPIYIADNASDGFIHIVRQLKNY